MGDGAVSSKYFLPALPKQMERTLESWFHIKEFKINYYKNKLKIGLQWLISNEITEGGKHAQCALNSVAVQSGGSNFTLD